MTGRKTLREIREQLAAARAGTAPATDSPQGQKLLEELDRLAAELAQAEGGQNLAGREPQSPDEVVRTSRDS